MLRHNPGDLRCLQCRSPNALHASVDLLLQGKIKPYIVKIGQYHLPILQIPNGFTRIPFGLSGEFAIQFPTGNPPALIESPQVTEMIPFFSLTRTEADVYDYYEVYTVLGFIRFKRREVADEDKLQPDWSNIVVQISSFDNLTTFYFLNLF